jgi:hypothetical protein
VSVLTAEQAVAPRPLAVLIPRAFEPIQRLSLHIAAETWLLNDSLRPALTMVMREIVIVVLRPFRKSGPVQLRVV